MKTKLPIEHFYTHVTVMVLEEIACNHEKHPVSGANIIACTGEKARYENNTDRYYGVSNFFVESDDPNVAMQIKVLPTCPKCSMLLEQATITRDSRKRTI